MLQLRPYQRDLLEQVEDSLADDAKERVMMQLPTGGGKTIIAGALLARWLTGGRKSVWLTHRKELAEQTCRMLTDARVPAMAEVRWDPGTDAPAMSQGAVILMAQTVGRRTARREVWNRYGAGDLMVIDEAHHAAAAGWERTMQQWPGIILGMTATPWRMSKKEGFDHLFGSLICGPQVTALQTDNWLCHTRTLIPPPEQRIIGGEVDRLSGEFTEKGIELANHLSVMTAGVLEFWQKHAGERPTIAYAVSVEHAHNLRDVFNDAGLPAAVILGDTSSEERNEAIAGFREGAIKVLVNVIVATEGFDLPDASCIAIARPTMSLALYLQMVGRGLRPKEDGSNCVILDLAANSVTHGLPEDDREWSLKPRGNNRTGWGPGFVRWCPECRAASPAASHHCLDCGYAFGKECGRCGKWRAWKRWRFENHCGNAHQLVCDLCHLDAHVQAHLPIIEPLDELIGIYDDTEDEMSEFPELNDKLANRLEGPLKELLEQELRGVTGASADRQLELREKVERRERELSDDEELDVLFTGHIASLTRTQRPKNRVQERRLFSDWEDNLKSELGGWKSELAILENQPVDKEAIEAVVGSARNKLLHTLQRVARAAGLRPMDRSQENLRPDGNGDRKDRGKDLGKLHHVETEIIPKELQDQIRVIQMMRRNGISHTEAFRSRAKERGIKENNLWANCVRKLGLSSVKEFSEHVENGQIVQVLKEKHQKYPDRIELIKRELEPLYR